ncbi:hypothetical protein B5F81_01315 [Muribaculum sp. An287]|nr:hypothetical protein B5F81_01315 [Muribaculum sp. An287]
MIDYKVHLPSAPPNNLANERKSLKSNYFKDFFVYAGMAKYGIPEQSGGGLKGGLFEDLKSPPF